MIPIQTKLKMYVKMKNFLRPGFRTQIWAAEKPTRLLTTSAVAFWLARVLGDVGGRKGCVYFENWNLRRKLGVLSTAWASWMNILFKAKFQITY